MTFEEKTINPALARRMLKKNRKRHNRNIRMAVVTRYALEMIMGNWVLSPHPICFNVNGELIDGQHRLWAIILSGCSIKMVVCCGVKDGVFSVLDQGLKRAVADVLEELPKTVQIAQSAFRIFAQQSTSSSSVISEFIAMYESEISIVRNSLLQGKTIKRVTVAPVAAVILAALVNGEDRYRIERFCELLRADFSMDTPSWYKPERDGAARKCRKMLIELTGTVPFRDPMVLSKVQNALRLFIIEQTVEKLYPMTRDGRKTEANPTGKYAKFHWEIDNLPTDRVGGLQITDGFRAEVRAWQIES